MVNHKSGKILTITFWETEEAINASASAANEIRKQAVEGAAAPSPIVEIYEVASKQ